VRLRIPAEQVYHTFLRTRWSQTRGVPWMHSVMLRMRMLAKYEEAELVASLVASAKMGFFETQTGDEFTGDSEEEGTQDQLIDAAEPGAMEQLPAGTKFTGWDPQHPTAAYGEFVKNGAKGIASGVNVSYGSLGGDLSDTSYSSMRYGSLEERDFYRTQHSFVDQDLCRPTFRDWLLMQLLSGRLPYQVSDFKRLYRPRFQLRGWDWVDPWRDVKSAGDAIALGLSTLTVEIEKRGYTLEQFCQMIQREKRIMAKYGVTFAGTPAGNVGRGDPDVADLIDALNDNRNNGNHGRFSHAH
jgi:lambda family phage portal protein